VAADKGSVAQGAPVTDDTIMAHMAMRKEEIMAADASSHGVARAAVNGDVLAKRVSIANFQARKFVIVFEVLRLLTQDGTRKDDVSAAQTQGPTQYCPGPQDAIRTDDDFSFDDRVRADRHIVGKFGLGGNDGGGMNPRKAGQHFASGVIDDHASPT
jgi:hypothetical protein